MANINITLEAGLTNDYGVFNLDFNKISCLSVDIISNGDLFVESENSEFQHGGNTNYRNHEGIKPKDSDTHNWENYGPTLVNKLKNYINSLIKDTYQSGELWEDYTKYANQFEVIFNKEPNNSTSKEYEYVSYNNLIVYVNDINKPKEIVTYTLEEGYKGIEIETYIIHFSKYYNIYSLTSGSLKVLRPLLYYSEDLDTYNIEINNNQPYLKYLACLNFWRGKSGWSANRYLRVDLLDYDSTTNLYDYNNRRTNIIDFYSDNNDDDHWSQFRTNPDNRPTFEMIWEEKWNNMPTGFFLLGFYNKSNGYWFDKTNTGSLPKNKYFPQEWENTFGRRSGFNISVHRTHDNGGLIGGNQYDKTGFIGFMYRYDKNKNWHIFNTYIPLCRDLMTIKDSIIYGNGNGNLYYPKSAGLIISSILTSMYVYKDESALNIKYISDIIFLGDYSTTYTKDIVYKIYKSKNIDENNKEVTDNDLLLFHKILYSTYITLLLEYTKDDNDKTFNNNNVNTIIKSGVKNIPLLFKLNYLQPKLDNIGDIASVKVCTITGEEINCSNDIIKPNELYYLDDNNNINNINSNFTIKWLQSLEEKDNKILLGKLDPKLENTPNSHIEKMFNYNDGNLGFNTNEIIIKSIPRYSIKTDQDYPNTFFDLLTNDILLPAARIF